MKYPATRITQREATLAPPTMGFDAVVHLVLPAGRFPEVIVVYITTITTENQVRSLI